MRYLYNTDNWDNNGGPIFFYCGNEGDIETFAANSVRRPSNLWIYSCLPTVIKLASIVVFLLVYMQTMIASG